jgi:biopolymer transport protein ExbD
VVLRLPPGDLHDLDPARPALALDIALDGPVRIAGKAFTDAELSAVFARTTKQARVILRADRGVPHGRVVDIIERARRAGLSEIGIATAGRR